MLKSPQIFSIRENPNPRLTQNFSKKTKKNLNEIQNPTSNILEISDDILKDLRELTFLKASTTSECQIQAEEDSLIDLPVDALISELVQLIKRIKKDRESLKNKSQSIQYPFGISLPSSKPIMSQSSASTINDQSQQKIFQWKYQMLEKLEEFGRLIGNTPLVEIKNIFSKPNVKIFAKMQGANPGGSAKDRIAYFIIRQAIKKGELKQGDKIIEATSGNSGIALAMIGSSLKIPVEIAMVQNSTIERVKIMEAYGAKVILTPVEQGLEGSRRYVNEQIAKGGYFCVQQYDNPDNSLAHYLSTGRQIYDDTNGKITHFLSAMGTTGTIMGVSKYLKQKNSGIITIGIEPEGDSQIPGNRKWPANYLPKIFEPETLNEVVQVSQSEAQEMTNRLSKEEGLFLGISSGGALSCAIKAAQKINQGCIVFVACDKGDRYLSSGVFNQTNN